MKEFPKLKSVCLYMDLHRLAIDFVQQFEKNVKPMLTILGVMNDINIRRYIHSKTFSDIYEDAVAANAVRVNLVEDLAKVKGEDFWAPMRAPGCDVKSPKDEGFVFREMPLADDAYRLKWIKAISVENCSLKISDQTLREESLVSPSRKVLAIYDTVAEFCDKLNAINIGKRGLRDLFAKDSDGGFKPNAEGIMWPGGGLH